MFVFVSFFFFLITKCGGIAYYYLLFIIQQNKLPKFITKCLKEIIYNIDKQVEIRTGYETLLFDGFNFKKKKKKNHTLK